MDANNALIEQDIEAYLKQHENKELLRFITCGSVDDGKSTLIGRLLFDTKMIFEDQLNSVTQDSKVHGTQGAEIDLALLVDGLQAEREQGITIDVAYRFFATDKRKFIVADTPGHQQYTRNMATGASTANAAVILVDARHGVLEQTRRHSFVTHLLGIRHLIIAVNKMDLVDYDAQRFDEIQQQYWQFAEPLGIEQAQFIPISALTGDNIATESSKMPWYSGSTLLDALEQLPLDELDDAEDFRFAVQWVNRPNAQFRGFSGTISAGRISVGDAITVYPSGQTTHIADIIEPSIPPKSTSIDTATVPMAVTLVTTDEVDISRGDWMVKSADTTPSVSHDVEVDLVWLHDTPAQIGQRYLLKNATRKTHGRLQSIEALIDVNTLAKSSADQLQVNEIAQAHIHFDQAWPFDAYADNRTTGSFILIDPISQATVGAAMVTQVLSDTPTVTPHRQYTPFEQDLNALIRQHFPEWETRAIDDLLK
ncbi:MAG: sulfate adenylyltransferase subunit CysN [Piscirickettsiaceae bacterium CG_4_9_14_3_um_filter_43_564]|nr:sulfate adenylyltransferase subunit CysN [Thiomicrospira sp.]OIP96540.1 MAG: sulfate adenylyltransferase subunit CysN [Thiomicrospira sp. CG2_30_44_34]PIQ02903.1 MAG: sulfate adenylyltransferase subunit CysN [Piscirickettsiaceae bacterium CG18_big_fil_WC_8_21_14_2_50_44_103]PIU38933.1 MAG: sulfate adenylyltransferase subunit CysN [Piscirickettsiaceae bacterium CG07_land_8_20_14_0_80_44_28]PIW57455.1 MAG: sulfate adenylyltransferase subunit CysN [Piscirickettsiaceae bacterium CG12_big_fil_rev